MHGEKGKCATISFTCRRQDGTVCGAAEKTTVTFVRGGGDVPRAIDLGIEEMRPGDHRVIRVAAAEATPFLGRFSRKVPTGYDFGPGDSGDVLLTVPPQPLRPSHEAPPAEADLLFEVTLVALREAV